jgi:acetyl esterase/lipase
MFLFLVFTALVTWSAYNLYQPVYHHSRLATVSFLAGWLTGELALHHILWQTVVFALFVWAGAVEGFVAALASLLCLASWFAMAWFYFEGDRAKSDIEQALVTGLGPDFHSHIAPELKDRFPAEPDYKKIKRPLDLIDPQIEVTKNQPFGSSGQYLDIYRARYSGNRCPVLMQIHGGAWTEKMGSKNEQALPLMNHMALRGWVCVSVDYRLSPGSTFPEAIIDCKEALVWIKQNIADFGGDPDFVVVTGGSAGGHLASLLALTINAPEFQPGFESEDTSLQGAVSFYGVYDFTDSEGHQPNDGLLSILEDSVMKLPRDDNLAAYEAVSPAFRIHAGAPPFLIIHGDKDSLVPVQEARSFAARLKQSSKQPVAYAEIQGAQHAFDMFPSLRSEHVKHGVEKFLAWLLSNR